MLLRDRIRVLRPIVYSTENAKSRYLSTVTHSKSVVYSSTKTHLSRVHRKQMHGVPTLNNWHESAQRGGERGVVKTQFSKHSSSRRGRVRNHDTLFTPFSVRALIRLNSSPFIKIFQTFVHTFATHTQLFDDDDRKQMKNDGQTLRGAPGDDGCTHAIFQFDENLVELNARLRVP